jgi:hypothetical protein
VPWSAGGAWIKKRKQDSDDFVVNPLSLCLSMASMAEGEGFEPPLPVRVKRFSRPPVSTTHTSLRMDYIFIINDLSDGRLHKFLHCTVTAQSAIIRAKESVDGHVASKGMSIEHPSHFTCAIALLRL